MERNTSNAGSDDGLPVSRLSEAQVNHAVAVLCDAFHDYPVMRYVIGPAGVDYDRHLHTLINFFVMARVWRREPILAVSNGSAPVATAVLTPPGKRHPPRSSHNFAKLCGVSLASQREGVMRLLMKQRRSLTLANRTIIST